MKEDTSPTPQGQAASPAVLDGLRVYGFDTDPEGKLDGKPVPPHWCILLPIRTVEHASIREKNEQVAAALCAFKALLAAAKLAIINSADVKSATILDEEISESLNAAILLAGGFTEEEQQLMENLALGLDDHSTED